MTAPDEQPMETPTATPVRTSRFAIASLVCAVSPFVALMLASLLGEGPIGPIDGFLSMLTVLTFLATPILGIMALVHIIREKGSLRGRSLAVVSLVIFGGFMALIVMKTVPLLFGNARRAKESTLRGNLHEIRTAVDKFDVDCGCYPARLEDLVQTTPPATGIDEKGNPVAITPKAYKGPYFTYESGINGGSIPRNPFAEDSPDIAGHWTYRKGIVKPAAPAKGKTIDRIPYQEL